MNTNGLAKQYDKLTPRERLPLIIAAMSRDDEDERRRLRDSAPTNSWRLPDYHGLADALHLMAMFHRIEILDLAGQLGHISRILDELENELESTKGKEGFAYLERWSDMLWLSGYVFTVHLDGWNKFCWELSIDPEALLPGLPGSETLARAELLARAAAFTPEGATKVLRRRVGNETAEVITVDEVVQGWRKALDYQLQEWT